jgi:hypothetical protein
MTEKYPDICYLILTLLTRPMADALPFPQSASEPTTSMLDLLKVERIDSFIMDAEVVAVDKDNGAYRTFQDLSNRAKKDVKVEDIKVIVGVYAFDLMLLNDKVGRRYKTLLTFSHCSTHRFPTGGIFCGRCSHPLPIRPTRSSPGSRTSRPSTQPTVLTCKRKCRRSSKW